MKQVSAVDVIGVIEMLDISNFPWAEFSYVENRNQLIIDNLSLKRKKRSKGSHRYEIELATIDMNMDLGRDIKAQLSNAHDDLIRYVHPRLSYTRGVEPAQGIKSNNRYAAGLRDIAFTSAGVWQLKSGDILTFANHTKVYEVVGDTSIKSGVSVIRLTNSLQQAVLSGEIITVNGVAWTLVSDSIIEVSTEAVENQDITIILNVVEDL